MSATSGVIEWFSRRAFPRLAALVTVGVAVGLVGTVLLLTASGPSRALGFRIAVVGYLVFLFGATGYLAFSVFSRAPG